MNTIINNKSKKDVSRSRAPNFTRKEQELLSKILESFIYIIESKKTDSVKQRDKQKAWLKITEIFNANTYSYPRTTGNLLSCYRNMKSKGKKRHSDALIGLEEIRTKQRCKEEDPLCATAVEEANNLETTLEENTYEPFEMPVEAQGSMKLRLNSVLKKKLDPDRNVGKENSIKLKPNVNESFMVLAEQNQELVKLNMLIAEEDIRDKKLSCRLKETELIQKKILNEMELEHKRKMYELELQEIYKENVFKEEMRQKELVLMNLKIKTYSE